MELQTLIVCHLKVDGALVAGIGALWSPCQFDTQLGHLFYSQLHIIDRQVFSKNIQFNLRVGK
jgi:hypothetical protein